MQLSDLIIQHEKGKTYNKACIVAGMPNSEYHAHAGISNSGLTKIDISPAHYRYAEPKDPTRAMEIGTAIHAAILEPERFKKEYMLMPEIKSRAASEYKKAASALGSEFVLVGKEVSNVLGMQDAILSNKFLKSRLSENGYTELSVFAFDPETGVFCKCRFDYISESLKAVDLKKTQDARQDAFSKSIFNYRYYVQDVFYRDVFEWCTGVELQSFEFLAVEESKPHGCMLHALPETAQMIGREEYRKNLNDYYECFTNDHWPAYECTETVETDLPYWAYSRYDNDIIQEIK